MLLFKKDKAEIHQDDKRKHEYAHLGQIKVPKGCKLFEYNLETKELKESETQVHADLNGKVTKKDRKTMAGNTMYVVAINQKNAARKLLKRLKAMK